MKLRAKTVLAIVTVLLTAAVGSAFMHPGTYGLLCESVGGKWGSNGNSCVTRTCFRHSTCGYWANPAARCGPARSQRSYLRGLLSAWTARSSLWQPTYLARE